MWIILAASWLVSLLPLRALQSVLNAAEWSYRDLCGSDHFTLLPKTFQRLQVSLRKPKPVQRTHASYLSDLLSYYILPPLTQICSSSGLLCWRFPLLEGSSPSSPLPLHSSVLMSPSEWRVPYPSTLNLQPSPSPEPPTPTVCSSFIPWHCSSSNTLYMYIIYNNIYYIQRIIHCIIIFYVFFCLSHIKAGSYLKILSQVPTTEYMIGA